MKKSEKYQGSWKNHVKAGQKKIIKVLLPTSDFRKGATLCNLDEYQYAKYLVILSKV